MATPGLNTPQAFSPLARSLQGLASVAVTTSGSLTHLAGAPFHALQRSISAIQSQIVSFVQMANPAAVIRFRFAWEDLQGTIGRLLLPVLNNLTLVIQKLADYLHAASGPAKGLTAVLITIGVVTAAVTGGLMGMTGALVVLKFVLDAFTGGISAVVGLIGAAVGALAAGGIGAVGMGLAVTPFEQLKQIIDQIGPPILKIFEMVGNAVMQFAGGALPGIINAIQAAVAGVNAILGSLGGAGNVFEVIGQFVGSFIQYLATGFQFVSVVVATFVDVLRTLGEILLPNVNLIGSLSSGLDRLMAVMKAISIVLAGEEGQQQTAPPPKAPPAVRQATSQSISSFITKAYVSAFSVGGGGDGAQTRHNAMMERMALILKEAESIAGSINDFLSEARHAVNNPAETAGKLADSNAGRAVQVASPFAFLARQLMATVTGK